MCNPAAVMAVSAVASAAGNAQKVTAQNEEAARTIGSREALLRNTISKQEDLGREATAAYQPVLDNAGDDASARNAAAQGRESAYAAAAPPAVIGAAPTATPGSVPQVVTSEIGRRVAQAGAAGSADAKRRAALDAYGDVGVGRGLARGRARGTLGMLSNFAEGEGALLPGAINASDTNIASQSGGVGFGDALAGAGKLGFLYGTTRPQGWSMFGDNPYAAKPGAGLAWRYDK